MIQEAKPILLIRFPKNSNPLIVEKTTKNLDESETSKDYHILTVISNIEEDFKLEVFNNESLKELPTDLKTIIENYFKELNINQK